MRKYLICAVLFGFAVGTVVGLMVAKFYLHI